MKKSTIIITSVVCGSILLLGCTNPSSPAVISRNLENNLNDLSTVVNRLDTIENSYLSNPDIYPITNSVNTPPKNSNYNYVARISNGKFNVNVPIDSHKNKIANLNLAITNDPAIKENIETQPLTELLENETPATYDENLENTQLTETNAVAYEVNNDEINNNEENKEENINNVDNNVDELELENNTEKNTIINITKYDLTPVRYSPRYYKINTENVNEDYLVNYINKVRTLYAITNDAIEANTTLADCKNNVLLYCVEIKDLNSAIKDGTFTPNSQQIAALNNYIDDIKITIKRIKKCNGELSDKVNSINKTDVGGIIAGIDVINSNYLSVLNHLDTRITYLKNALTTLEQIKQLLLEAEQIVENNDELNNNQNNDTVIVENNNENLDNIDKESGNIVNENEPQNNEENVENNAENNTTNENVKNSTETTTENENEKPSNIDTYLNTNNNLDTYKPINNEQKENNTSDTINNEEQNTDNLVNNNANNNIAKESNVNTNLNNNLNNTANNNGIGGSILNPTDEEKINAPNGTFQNGIITQNNLNNGVNNGINGVHSGYAGSNNYPNNSNINNTNKNVDTYGFNTMIDMLNNGTVNNGINTLNISEETSTKPSMVSGEASVETNKEEETKEFENPDAKNVEELNDIDKLDDVEDDLNNTNAEILPENEVVEEKEILEENNVLNEENENKNIDEKEETKVENEENMVEDLNDENSNTVAPKNDGYEVELL